MALEQKLHLKLSQKLIMTPSLQQAIKLLQLSKLELQEVLNQELLENPLLDELSEETKQEEAEADVQQTKTETEEEAKAAELRSEGHEAVANALSVKLSREASEIIVAEASRKALAEKRHLSTVLAEDPRVTAHMTPGELARVFELMSYQGVAQTFIERIVGSLQARGMKRP